MRFILCEKQFLYLNTDADAVNAEMLMRNFQVASTDCYTTLFFGMIQN